MQKLLNKNRGRPKKKESRAEFVLLIILIAFSSVNIKILCDIYRVLTDTNDDFPAPIEPIGFYKCPKNKKSEGLYCPIFPQEKR
jgi:hypothetical protein